MEKSREEDICPVCNKKLKDYYYGLVCKNWECVLFYKLEKGWVKLTNGSNWSRKRNYVNLFYNSNYRLFLAKQFSEVKKKVLIRDDYTCQKCKTDPTEEVGWGVNVHVHHIIPASEEMGLYLDMDNLITLCEECHSELHKYDKRGFRNGDDS